MDLVRAHHVVNLIRVHAGRVDDITGLNLPVIRLDRVSALNLSDAGHLGVQTELRSVHRRVLRHRDVQHKRADDAGRRGVKSGARLVGDVRLHRYELLPLNDPQPLDAVFSPALQQIIQFFFLFGIGTDDEGPDSLKRKIQLFRERLHHAVSLDIQLCHERAGAGVKARVRDGAVRLRSAAADILSFFEDADRNFVARKLSGHRTAGHSGADNGYIYHIRLLS